MTQVGLVTHGDADLQDSLYEEIFIGKYGIPCHLMSPVTLVSWKNENGVVMGKARQDRDTVPLAQGQAPGRATGNSQEKTVFSRSQGDPARPEAESPMRNR